MGFLVDAPTTPARPNQRTSKHLRRTKLFGAVALTALIGLGSYAVTYRALVLISVPAQVTAPAHTGGSTTVTVPQPSTPAQPHP